VQVKSILDPSFRYTPSFETDLRKTFARIRRDRRGDPVRAPPPAENEPANVSPIFGKIAKGRS